MGILLQWFWAFGMGIPWLLWLKNVPSSRKLPTSNWCSLASIERRRQAYCLLNLDGFPARFCCSFDPEVRSVFFFHFLPGRPCFMPLSWTHFWKCRWIVWFLMTYPEKVEVLLIFKRPRRVIFVPRMFHLLVVRPLKLKRMCRFKQNRWHWQVSWTQFFTQIVKKRVRFWILTTPKIGPFGDWLH